MEPMSEKEKIIPESVMNKPPTASPAPPKPQSEIQSGSSTAPVKPIQPPSTAMKTAPKKRRKRKGLAGLFVALGCLSAGDFEEDKDKQAVSGGMSMSQNPGNMTTTSPTGQPSAGSSSKLAAAPVASPPETQASPPTRERTTETAGTGATGTTGSILVGRETDKVKGLSTLQDMQPTAVIVAPVEPVTLPDDEVSLPHCSKHR